MIKETVDGELGCAIGGGIDQDEFQNPFTVGDSGIFISKIRKHGAADKAGLEVGDKLVQVKKYKKLPANSSQKSKKNFS